MSSCWQCGEAVPEADLFCPACDTLQPPRPGRSHFDVLGLAPRFEVDLAAMERAFKGLSRQLHPDRFALESAAVRRLSMEHATALNDAYRALKDEGQRARYLLELWGRPITEKSGRSAPLPFDFLEEVLEARERMAMAKHAGEGDVLDAELGRIRQQAAALGAQMRALFRQHDEGEGDGDALAAAIEQVVHQQKYLQSILNEYGGGR